MVSPRNIQTSRSADLVTFKVLIDGAELSASVNVLNISVEKEINRIPSAKLVITDGDPASQEFAVSNDTLLIPGKEIEIKAGYHSVDETIFKGIIIKHSLKIRPQYSLLIVECRDKAVKLTSGRKSKYYSDKKDSDIIDELVASYSLESDVAPTSQQHKELVQCDCTDWDFIVTRAQANGKVCVVDDGKVTVKAPDFSQAEVETVSYGATLLDFDAEIDVRNQFSKITSYAWDQSKQEVSETEAANPAVALNGNLSSSDLASVVGLDNLKLTYGGTTSDGSIQDWANARNLFNQLAKVRGRIKFQGIPACKPNTTLMLQGVGDRFNGKVYISAIRHEIAEGQLVWNEMIRSFYDPFHAKVEGALAEAERANGVRILGIDPTSGKELSVRIGRFGPVAQLGEVVEGGEKPLFASLRAGQHLETLSIEDALELFKLPRNIGEYEGKPVTVAIGRFGPYVRHNSIFVSLEKDIDDPYTVELDRAIELIEAKREKDKNAVIKIFDENPEVKLLNGRWGPYISFKKSNYKIPKATDATKLTLDDCLQLIEKQPVAKKGRKK